MCLFVCTHSFLGFQQYSPFVGIIQEEQFPPLRLGGCGQCLQWG